MSIEERARRFVGRADEALQEIGSAAQAWTASVGSRSDESRLHSLSLELDYAIRKAEGRFETWSGFDPAQVQMVAENGPIELLWVLSAHPSGRVREAFVHSAKDLSDDRILPHLTNRSLDFVKEINEPASSLVVDRLRKVLAERSDSGDHGELSTAAHIAVDKLLMPRTAVVRPELIDLCIDVANTSGVHRPGALSGSKLERMQQRCRQTLASSPEPASVAAIEALTAYFDEHSTLS